MAGLFLTYRQQDRPMVAAALDFLLAGHFGRDQVFRDCVSVPPGADYAREIERRVAAAEVLVVVIGPGWRAATGAGGGRALDRPADWVRREIRSALQCGITLVPLLLDDTPPLLPAELPTDIRALARCQAVRIRHTSFEPDYLALVRQLERHVLPARPAPEPGRVLPAGLGGGSAGPAASRLAGEAAVLLAAFALPVLAAWTVAGAARPAALLLGLLALASVAALVMFLAGVLLVYANRDWSDRVDRQLTALPPTGRHATAFGLLVAILGGLMLLVGRGRGGLATGWLPLLFAAAIVTVAWAALRWLRQHPARGPGPLPEVRPEPAAIRRALARLTDRLTHWPAPLSRSRRELAVDALDRIEHAVDTLDRLAAGTRRTWLLVDSRRPSAAYAVWLAGTGGLVAGAAVCARLAGRPAGLVYPALAAALLGVAVIGVVTTELRYRHHRWLQGVVVAESRTELRRLRGRLAELTGERPGPAAG